MSPVLSHLSRAAIFAAVFAGLPTPLRANEPGGFTPRVTAEVNGKITAYFKHQLLR